MSVHFISIPGIVCVILRIAWYVTWQSVHTRLFRFVKLSMFCEGCMVFNTLRDSFVKFLSFLSRIRITCGH